MMTVHSSTSTRLKTTNGSSVHDFQIQRLRLPVSNREPRRAALDLLEELGIGAFAIFQIIHRDGQISIFGRQCPDTELPLLVGAACLDKARWERPLCRIIREHDDRVVA